MAVTNRRTLRCDAMNPGNMCVSCFIPLGPNTSRLGAHFQTACPKFRQTVARSAGVSNTRRRFPVLAPQAPGSCRMVASDRMTQSVQPPPSAAPGVSSPQHFAAGRSLRSTPATRRCFDASPLHRLFVHSGSACVIRVSSERRCEHSLSDSTSAESVKGIVWNRVI